MGRGGGLDVGRPKRGWFVVFLSVSISAICVREESGLDGGWCAILNNTVEAIEALVKTPYCYSGIVVA